MRRAFGDSFFFIALLNARDIHHRETIDISRGWEGAIVTTRWVLAEVGNALSSIPGRKGFAVFMAGLERQRQFEVLPGALF